MFAVAPFVSSVTADIGHENDNDADAEGIDEPMDGIEKTGFCSNSKQQESGGGGSAEVEEGVGSRNGTRDSSLSLPPDSTKERKRTRSISAEREPKRVRTEMESDGEGSDVEDGSSLPRAISEYPNSPLDLTQTGPLTPAELQVAGKTKFLSVCRMYIPSSS